MCASTIFQEVIPLRNITAPVIVKAFIKFFTMVGLPKVVQSDQVSTIMSVLSPQIIYKLKIRQVKSHHPRSQGAKERFQSLCICWNSHGRWITLAFERGIRFKLTSDYMSTFQDRLLRATEVAWGNLKLSKDKMDSYCNGNDKDRHFSPGKRVLVLLAIPCRPGQP